MGASQHVHQLEYEGKRRLNRLCSDATLMHKFKQTQANVFPWIIMILNHEQ